MRTYRAPFAGTKRKKPGEMNRLEKKYADEILEPLKVSGEIVEYVFERIKLKIAPNCYYIPDFMVIMESGEIIFDEIKGGYMDNKSIVKFKSVCEQYWWFKFRMQQWIGKNKKKNILVGYWKMIREN